MWPELIIEGGTLLGYAADMAVTGIEAIVSAGEAAFTFIKSRWWLAVAVDFGVKKVTGKSLEDWAEEGYDALLAQIMLMFGSKKGHKIMQTMKHDPDFRRAMELYFQALRDEIDPPERRKFRDIVMSTVPTVQSITDWAEDVGKKYNMTVMEVINMRSRALVKG